MGLIGQRTKILVPGQEPESQDWEFE